MNKERSQRGDGDSLFPARSRRRRNDRLDQEAQSVLCKWFGWNQDLVASSAGLPEEELRLRECMDSLLEQIGVKERIVGKELLDRWEEVVGRQVALHARPVGLSRGVLTVSCDHPAWLQELRQFHERVILRNIASVFGPDLVQRLHFRIG